MHRIVLGIIYKVARKLYSFKTAPYINVEDNSKGANKLCACSLAAAIDIDIAGIK